jgi:hypothetical protein
MASGPIYTKRLREMLHDQIVQEDKIIQEELEREVTSSEPSLLPTGERGSS